MTFWFVRFDVNVKIDNGEEMTERNPSLPGIECGKSTFGEGTEKPSFRAGEEIAMSSLVEMARLAYSSGKLDDEARVNFHSQKPVKIKRRGYSHV